LRIDRQGAIVVRFLLDSLKWLDGLALEQVSADFMLAGKGPTKVARAVQT
jgi:hypothetical protein